MDLIRTAYAFQVSPQWVDFRYKITLSALTDVLLTAAQYNADENGFGIRDLQLNQSSWVLLRFALEMDYMPEQYENITVDTWIHSIGRVSTTRNFSIRNEKGECIGHAISNWAMIDMQTRKAMDLMTLQSIRQYVNENDVPIARPAKLNAVKGEVFDTFRARYSHIDINQHVNTMRYVEWICNYFDLDHYSHHHLKRFDINFLAEILIGDSVEMVAACTAPGDFSFEILNNGASGCRARLIFESLHSSN
jgi:acyl-ACP thioesterase